jgi:hypothetical protein
MPPVFAVEVAGSVSRAGRACRLGLDTLRLGAPAVEPAACGWFISLPIKRIDPRGRVSYERAGAAEI